MASSCGTISVREAFDSNRVSVDSCSGLPSEGAPGAEVNLNVTVSNDNDLAAEGSVYIEADGRELGRKSFVTAGGGRTDLSIDINLPSLPGDYNVDPKVRGVSQGVGGLSVGSEEHRGRDRAMSRY